MGQTTLERARAGDGDAFQALVEPHRRELVVHRYRILGSVRDAEDLLQEVLLSAWRALDGFAAVHCRRGCTASPRTTVSTTSETGPGGHNPSRSGD
jgi:DNA-directed RNA polymerase specialized sigma24 family protein